MHKYIQIMVSAVSTNYSFLGIKSIYVLWIEKIMYKYVAWILSPSWTSSKVKSVDATCDNKILKATYGGHQLTKRILRGRENFFIRNAMKLPLPKLENSECIGIKMITAPQTMLHFYFLCQKNSLCITTKLVNMMR